MLAADILTEDTVLDILKWSSDFILPILLLVLTLVWSNLLILIMSSPAEDNKPSETKSIFPNLVFVKFSQ